MDKVTNDIRTQNWAAIVEQCESRPEGLTKKEWMAQNGISEKQYYYWLRKIRHQAAAGAQLIPAQDTASCQMPMVHFAEVSLDDAVLPEADPGTGFTPAVIIQTGRSVIQISGTAPDYMASRIIKAVAHAL